MFASQRFFVILMVFTFWLESLVIADSEVSNSSSSGDSNGGGEGIGNRFGTLTIEDRSLETVAVDEKFFRVGVDDLQVGQWTRHIPSSQAPHSTELNLIRTNVDSARPTVTDINTMVDCSEISGQPFPENVKWSEDSRNLSCPSKFKTCLPMCCPLGETLIRDSCVKESDDSGNVGKIRVLMCSNDSRDVYYSNQNPCALDWMVSKEIRNFWLFENGLFYSPDLSREWLLSPENYCLFREPILSHYVAKVCLPRPGKSWWDIFCCICIILIMLAIFIGYNIIPELNNLYSMIFRSYVATYIGTYLCIFGVEMTTELKTLPDLFVLLRNTAYYLECSGALWLNVMSIAIWRTFRCYRSIDHNMKKREKKKFIWYAIYAWGLPALLITTCVTLMHYDSHLKNLFGRTLTWWSTLGLTIAALICNTLLYILTARTINQQKKNTVHLTDGVDKHQEIAKQWFNMYVKLFIIMTGHIGGGLVPFVLWLAWPTPLMTGLLSLVQLIQSILTFYVFLWKHNIKQSLRDQLSGTLRRLHYVFDKSESTRTVES